MAGRGDPAGLATAAAEAGAGAPPSAGIGDQASLFGAEPVEADGIGGADLGPVTGPRRPGRPPGSRNRSTEEWSRYLLTRYRSPLIGLAELAQANPHDLAAELTITGEGGKVTPLDALRVIVGAAQALAPYLHQKQPTALDVGGGGLMQILIGDLGSAQAGEVRILPDPDTVENQGVAGDADGASEPGGRNA